MRAILCVTWTSGLYGLLTLKPATAATGIKGRSSYRELVLKIGMGLLALPILCGGCSGPGSNPGQPIPNLERRFKVTAALMAVVDWSSDGSKLAVGSKTPPFHILNANSGNEVGSIQDI